MCRRIISILFKFCIFLISIFGGFVLCDYVTFKKLDFMYGYSLTQKELEIVQETRKKEYDKGNFYLFNWVPYKVEKEVGGYNVFFYPPNADGFSLKYFLFVFTDGFCCGQKKFFLEQEYFPHLDKSASPFGKALSPP